MFSGLNLKGNSIYLRALQADDLDNLYQVASDPLVWEQHPQKRRSERPFFEGFFKEALKNPNTYIIIDSLTEKIIGSSRYYDYLPEEKKVSIGYTFIARSHGVARQILISKKPC